MLRIRLEMGYYGGVAPVIPHFQTQRVARCLKKKIAASGIVTAQKPVVFISCATESSL